jgi:hypothetical protein
LYARVHLLHAPIHRLKLERTPVATYTVYCLGGSATACTHCWQHSIKHQARYSISQSAKKPLDRHLMRVQRVRIQALPIKQAAAAVKQLLSQCAGACQDRSRTPKRHRALKQGCRASISSQYESRRAMKMGTALCKGQTAVSCIFSLQRLASRKKPQHLIKRKKNSSLHHADQQRPRVSRLLTAWQRIPWTRTVQSE